MSTFEIRPCRVENIDLVLALWRRADAVPRPTDNRAALMLRLERAPQLFALPWNGDTVAGTLLGGWDGWRGNMYRLSVDPAIRRLGVARRLVAAVEDDLAKLGAERITSLVFRDEPGAEAFWKRIGYATDPATKRFAKDLGQ